MSAATYSPGPSWAGSFVPEAVTMPATLCTCDSIPYLRDGRVRLERILPDRCCEATHEDEVTDG